MSWDVLLFDNTGAPAGGEEMPDGWDPVAGFPAMAGNVPFLMKDVVLLAASIYLLKQDLVRLPEAVPGASVARSQA